MKLYRKSGRSQQPPQPQQTRSVQSLAEESYPNQIQHGPTGNGRQVQSRASQGHNITTQGPQVHVQQTRSPTQQQSRSIHPHQSVSHQPRIPPGPGSGMVIINNTPRYRHSGQ